MIFESWYDKIENSANTVLYTRCDLGRNISGFNFPNNMTKTDSQDIISIIFSFFKNEKKLDKFKTVTIESLSQIGLKLLEERNILPKTMPSQPCKAIAVHDNGALYATINTNNHIDISAFCAGLNTQTVFVNAVNLLSIMETQLCFASDDKAGYITTDIFRIGSGLKISALCSLPGYLYTKKIPELIKLLKKYNLSASGYYETESKNLLTGLFLLSNNGCENENEITQTTSFHSAIENILQTETELLQEFYDKNHLKVEDMVNRAIAISQNAKLINFNETIDIISKIKLGLNLNLIEGVNHTQCNSAIYRAQTGHLIFSLLNKIEQTENKNIQDTSIEEYRAIFIKDLLSNIQIIR